MINKAYKDLWDQSKRIELLSGVSQILDWDQEIFMPEGGADLRGDQLKLLAGMVHEERISRKFTEPLSQLIDLKSGYILAPELNEREISAVKEWHRDYLIETALPTEFVEDFAKLCSESIIVWRSARKNNDFKIFSPYLKKLIEANCRKADLIGFKNHPYDALLDLYEPGMTTASLHPIFEDLKKGNIALLKQISEKKLNQPKEIYDAISQEQQLEFAKEILKQIGYDFKYGRIDLSTHPFSTGSHPSDSRITTRIDSNNIFSCISTILHEAGHSLYTMGLPASEFGTPLGSPVSMGIHESQSRFWETRIGLSLPFIQFLLPQLQKKFPSHFNKLTPELCFLAINKVEPSFIRVEADEVTYPLHVILRFELEVALIEGSLKVNDVPDAWNSKMKEFLNITPPNDAKGCLQDIHWAMGAFGYFPTYALGNLYAAEIFSKFAKDHPDWNTLVSQGKFNFIREFLNENVYRFGREYRSLQLVHNITGHKFSSKPYTDYLHEKFTQF